MYGNIYQIKINTKEGRCYTFYRCLGYKKEARAIAEVLARKVFRVPALCLLSQGEEMYLIRIKGKTVGNARITELINEEVDNNYPHD